MIRAEKSDLQIGYYGAFERGNHVGNDTSYRDGYTVAAFHTPEQDSLTTLAVVTHAIGGREAYFGSELLLQTMNEVFDQTSTIEDVPRLLEHGFQLADPLIVQVGEIAVSSSAVVIVGRRLYVASIGDCRIFLIRAGKSKQLSIEHTFAERLIAHGDTTPEELMESTYDGRCPYRILGQGLRIKSRSI